ncbi:MAG: gas vesicle protein [Longimicrobiales bacterium]|nr:gas vesicle protein [Longimicrobiales bacterium]
MAIARGTAHSLESTNLADLLERILDKGIVIAGDIRVNLVEVELLTIQIRLVICSVDKAREMGMDWWVNNPAFSSRAANQKALPEMVERLEERLTRIETSLASGAPTIATPPVERVRRKGPGRPTRPQPR